MLAVLKVGDKHAAKAGVGRQVDLVPTTLLPQLADPLAKGDADILMSHAAMMHVLFALRVASALHGPWPRERLMYETIQVLDAESTFLKRTLLVFLGQ